MAATKPASPAVHYPFVSKRAPALHCLARDEEEACRQARVRAPRRTADERAVVFALRESQKIAAHLAASSRHRVAFDTHVVIEVRTSVCVLDVGRGSSFDARCVRLRV